MRLHSFGSSELPLITLFGYLFVFSVNSKMFTKCGLSEELSKLKFPRTFIGNWICLIESESGRNTSKITLKPDRSKNLGIFQINDKIWCQYGGKPGGNCQMRCENLLDENIADDGKCAQLIQNERGFKDWSGWLRNCYGQKLTPPIC